MTFKEKISLEIELEDLMKLAKGQMEMIMRLKRIASDIQEELGYSFPDEIISKIEELQEKFEEK